MISLGRKFHIGLSVWVVAILCNQGWLPILPIVPFSGGYSDPYPYLGMLLTLVLYIIALRLIYIFFKFIFLSLIKKTFCKQNLLEIIIVIAVVAGLWVLPSRAEVSFWLYRESLQAHVNSTRAAIKEMKTKNISDYFERVEFINARLKQDNQVIAAKTNAEINIEFRNEAILYDFGYAVPSLIYNAAGQQSFQEGRALCQEEEGGFIKKLAPHWFLCRRLHSV